MNDNLYVKIKDISITKVILESKLKSKDIDNNRLFDFEKQIGLKYKTFYFDRNIPEGKLIRVYEVVDKSKFIFAVMKYSIEYSSLQ